MAFITIVFINIYIILLYIFFNKNKSISSDHFFHLKLSNEIRENKGKLITHFKHLLIPTPIYYPQLYHKILSLFSKEFVDKKGHFLNYFFNGIIISLLIISINIFKSEMNINENNLSKIQIYSALLFITTPFFYVFWNAKNMGISGRSFGLFIGYLYFFNLLYLINTLNYLTLIPLIIISSIAWFGSNFAFQAILFISSILSFFYIKLSFFIFIPIILGFFSWFILNPSVAKVYYLELFRLKIMFYKHLIYTMSLNNRPSIWGDFLTGFYKKYKTSNKKDFFIYVYTNSIISALMGFPAIFFILFHIYINYTSFTPFQNSLSIIIISGLIIFFLTSFRKTRFLGEPERYLEFILPFACILFFSSDNKLLYITFIVNILLLILNYKIIKSKKNSSSNDLKKEIDTFVNVNCNNNSKKEINILSNNETITRYLMEYDNIKLFFAYISKEETLGIPFNEIYEKHGDEYKPNALNTFYKYTNFDYLIIKSNELDNYILQLKNIGDINFNSLTKIDERPNLVFFKINT